MTGDSPSEDKKARKRAKTVGAARQEFGTRTSRRIDCTRCGKSDHVPFVPRNRENVLCRACAEEVVNVYEVGVQLPRAMRDATCAVCQVTFQISEKVPEDAEVLCRECLRGNATWQGGLHQDPSERGDGQSESLPSGLRLRKRKK
jgi:CxxC-x17-CxxC domain-containing protein